MLRFWLNVLDSYPASGDGDYCTYTASIADTVVEAQQLSPDFAPSGWTVQSDEYVATTNGTATVSIRVDCLSTAYAYLALDAFAFTTSVTCNGAGGGEQPATTVVS